MRCGRLTKCSLPSVKTPTCDSSTRKNSALWQFLMRQTRTLQPTVPFPSSGPPHSYFSLGRVPLWTPLLTRLKESLRHSSMASRQKESKKLASDWFARHLSMRVVAATSSSLFEERVSDLVNSIRVLITYSLWYTSIPGLVYLIIIIIPVQVYLIV